MPKKQSPAGGPGKNEKRSETTLLYPATLPDVKPLCADCLYFREVPIAKRTRTFCRFTGEHVTENWECGFWTAEGGEA